MNPIQPEPQQPQPGPLLDDVRARIDVTRRQAATAVNLGLTLLYWRIGRRIGEDVLGGERAAYGEQIVSTLSRQLVSEYGRSFGVSNLRHMLRFAESFPEEQIVYALSRQLAVVESEIKVLAAGIARPLGEVTA